MRKLVLICFVIVNSFAIYSKMAERENQLLEKAIESSKECLSGNVKQCNEFARYAGSLKAFFFKLGCIDYMKTIKKGCQLGSGPCCTRLGDEFHPISKKVFNNLKYEFEWVTMYGKNCSLRDSNEAFKYYKKSCDLGGSGCQRYSELINLIDEIEERDKAHKSDITIRVK